MSHQHRSTPVVHAPALGLTAPDRGRARDLRAPVVAVTATGEWELEQGVLVIGRGTDAHIAVEDPLVSRQHARLAVLADGQVVVEDLHSTNGVFVNGVRLSRPVVRLREGDRLLIGTTELSVFSNQNSGKIPIRPRAPASDEVTPKLKQLVFGSPSSTTIGAVIPVPSTVRSDAFSMVRNLADRLMGSGQQAEAVQVLSEHLNNVLLGASNGLSAQPAVLEHASRCAIKLFHWTKRTSWLDYVFELHLVCQSLPSSSTLDLLEVILPVASGFDVELVRYLARGARDRAGLSADDELSLERLERLLS